MLTPNTRQLEWLSRDKTAFLHFGMNTFTDREWGDGTEDPALFNPSKLDCRQWIRVLKETGFDAAILTAKHHDGFCLWPSKYTEHSVKNSPYQNGKGDIVREFTDACREFGIKAGLYLSPWDRHEPTWGSDAYNDFYVGQLTELLTDYGDIYECWWDGAGSERAHYDWKRWGETVRTLQPNAVIFGSLGATPYVDIRWVGNEKGIAGKPCYATVDYRDLELEITANLNRGSMDGTAFLPAEADVSIRPGWFYHADQDLDVRSSHNLFKLWLASRGRNAGLLLNIPPDRRGLLCDADINSLRGFHSLLQNALSHNLAITATEQSKKGLLSDTDFDTVDTLPHEILITLDKPQSFNLFTLAEAIEFGQAVTHACIEVEADGTWQTVAETACVGNLWAEQIPTTTAQRVRIRILDAIAPVKLRKFGLFRVEEASNTEELPLTATNQTARKRTVIEQIPSGWIVDFGGIYPFNQIRMQQGALDVSVEVFNGFSFDPLIKRSNPDASPLNLDLPCTVDYAYRVKITVEARTEEFDPDLYPRIYLT